jgi:DNA-binding Xre family transcriptional regulator
MRPGLIPAPRIPGLVPAKAIGAEFSLLRMLLAQAVRFTTLAMLCEVLECQPGDLLRWKAADAAGG